MKRFNAITSGNTIGDGSRNALMKWLERFVQVLFPDNGIEYWSDFDRKGAEPVGTFGRQDGMIHFACYVRTGHCEGRILEIDALYRENRFERLITIKSFGSDSECWLIAAAISDALESIYKWHEIPCVVEMNISLPRRCQWDARPTLRGPVVIAQTPTSISLSNGGSTFWERRFDKSAEVAQHYIEAYLRDWKTVLSSFEINAVEMEVDATVSGLAAI